MTEQLVALGDALAVPAVVLLWLAVLLRAPAAVRSPDQRGLLFAVATAAAAMTLNLPDLVAWATRDPGHSHLVGLIRNLSGVLSAGAVFCFVVGTTRGGRARTVGWISTGVLLTALVTLDTAVPGHGTHTMAGPGEPVPSMTYWIVLILCHLTANTACVFVCWRYSRRTESPGLALGLRLFGLGTALAGAFWFAYLLKGLFGVVWPLPYLALVMNLHALLRAAALVVPLAHTGRHSWAGTTTAWRLWPLWHDLVGAVPHVALTRGRGGRLGESLWPPVPRTLLGYRKVIETRDAMLVLGEHVPADAPDRARAHVRAAGVPAELVEAAALACVLADARRALLAGDGPVAEPGALPTGLAPDPTPDPEAAALAQDTRFLVAVARAYGSPVTAEFPSARAARSDTP
ncbi:MAB_1171c family putative transporter [Streptomyces sp. BI20]|uniref:MAB_1171c family putative transporter n=1 Tax=Streptomyces sp. BI20 TaxID=3403460 RepID=UPI003C74A966